MIQIREFKETTCELYDPDDKLIGTITSFLSLEDIRIQIRELLKTKDKNYPSGYYIMWQGQTIQISNYGNLEKWPVGFFDIHDKLLDQLLD